MLRHRWAGRTVAGLAAVALLIGCSSGGASRPPTATSAPTPTAAPTQSVTPTPFRLDFPDGWVVGQPTDLPALLDELETMDSDEARKLRELIEASATPTSALVAYHVGSSDEVVPDVGCTTLDRGGLPVKTVLDLGEEQNVEHLAQYPGIVGAPTSDRLTLPVGETVRVRWRWESPAGSERTSIGYLFVGGPIVVTCVFSAASDTVAGHEPGWEAILGTFELTAAAAASPAGSPSGRPHEAEDVESLLPNKIAGRWLDTWSVRGESVLDLWGYSAGEIADVREQLAALGVDVDDVAQGTAGRSDLADPPYFVHAFRIPAAARDLLGGRAIAAAGFTRDTDAWDLEDREIGGKEVAVGPLDLIHQTEHERGRPYLYGSTALDVSFIVITDDEAWAEEAIRALPD
ncbi:MAG: hypothetical protein OEV60_07455 [Actinomycetota bacterium]|jgi:hypothetical protein|nr:hypothetical protein [Actinomycetota bacterium]MDH5242451.1 hypothetical protein [Chloroflexota bacterium]